MNNKRGFLALEYATLIVIVVAALIGMALVIKRAVCGKYQEVGTTFGSGRQYKP